LLKLANLLVGLPTWFNGQADMGIIYTIFPGAVISKGFGKQLEFAHGRYRMFLFCSLQNKISLLHNLRLNIF